jgi:hypothetical protein
MKELVRERKNLIGLAGQIGDARAITASSSS